METAVVGKLIQRVGMRRVPNPTLGKAPLVFAELGVVSPEPLVSPEPQDTAQPAPPPYSPILAGHNRHHWQ